MNHSKRAAILGCGPAGLLAAWAAEQLGFEPAIYSKRIQSQIGGAQFLHQSIPGLPDEPRPCRVVFRGTAEGYAEKVYGDPNAPTSWSLLEPGEHTIWPMVQIYDDLWKYFRTRIYNLDLGPRNFQEIPQDYDICISTIPVPALCIFNRTNQDPPEGFSHQFYSQPVWIKYDHPLFDPGTEALMPNTVLYDGAPAYRGVNEYYRASNLFGVRSAEYGQPTLLGSPQRLVHKPLSTTCDCYPNIIRQGRYGKFEKGVLAHEAYTGTKEACLAVLSV